MSIRHTRNQTSSAKEDLKYAMENTMEQLKEQIQRVCASNETIEKRLQSLMDRIDNINVSFMSRYACVLF